MRRASPSLRVALLAAFVTLVFVPLAVAGKPGGSGASSSSLQLVDLSPENGVALGDQVTFNVSTSATATPWVTVRCYQGSMNVYTQWHGFFADYRYGQVFELGPTPMWQAGGADCTARLVAFSRNGRETTLASQSFTASA